MTEEGASPASIRASAQVFQHKFQVWSDMWNQNACNLIYVLT
jgi:hypothetical protein